MVATILWTVAIVGAVGDANQKHTVVYSVTGTIGSADINYYSSDGSGHLSQSLHHSVPLPFSKTITIEGDFSGFDLTANTHIGLHTPKGSLKCTISVDGKIVSRDSFSGQSDFVSCEGNGYDGAN